MNTATHQIACPHCGAINRIPAARAGDDPDCGRCHQPLLSGQPIELGDANFDAVVNASTLPVVEMAMVTQRPDKVDSDAAPRLSQRFGIRSIPTLMRFQGGQEVRRQSGAIPAAQIVAFAA